MNGYEVIILVSVIEVELHSTLVAYHVAYAHSLCVGLDLAVEV